MQQLYRMAAGGSREQPSAVLLPNGSVSKMTGYNARSIELLNHETFSGAACCQLTELPSYKAAPLQAWSSFPPACLQASFRSFYLTSLARGDLFHNRYGNTA